MTPRSFGRIAGLACFLVLMFSGLANAQGPVYATPFQPPLDYLRWYGQVEECAKLRGDYSQIIWTVTPKPWFQKLGSDTPSKDSSATFGLWHQLADGRAVIILTAVDWRNESYVKHEMLHDILGRNGYRIPAGRNGVPDSVNVRAAHPAPPFEKCAPTYIDKMRELERQKQNPFTRVYRP